MHGWTLGGCGMPNKPGKVLRTGSLTVIVRDNADSNLLWLAARWYPCADICSETAGAATKPEKQSKPLVNLVNTGRLGDADRHTHIRFSAECVGRGRRALARVHMSPIHVPRHLNSLHFSPMVRRTVNFNDEAIFQAHLAERYRHLSPVEDSALPPEWRHVQPDGTAPLMHFGVCVNMPLSRIVTRAKALGMRAVQQLTTEDVEEDLHKDYGCHGLASRCLRFVEHRIASFMGFPRDRNIVMAKVRHAVTPDGFNDDRFYQFHSNTALRDQRQEIMSSNNTIQDSYLRAIRQAWDVGPEEPLTPMWYYDANYYFDGTSEENLNEDDGHMPYSELLVLLEAKGMHH